MGQLLGRPATSGSSPIFHMPLRAGSVSDGLSYSPRTSPPRGEGRMGAARKPARLPAAEALRLGEADLILVMVADVHHRHDLFPAHFGVGLDPDNGDARLAVLVLEVLGLEVFQAAVEGGVALFLGAF